MTTSASTPALTSTKTWIWQGFPICYQAQGTVGPSVVLVHGFGASWGHWRKNIPILAQSCRVYAIDLIGFGASAKPEPKNAFDYTFENWGRQIADFCREVVGEPTFLVANSIGCIAIMQAAVTNPDIALGVALLNCSLRLLHDSKRITLPWYRRFGAPILQHLLSIKPIGNFFFRQIAKPKTVEKILLQAYSHKQAVTKELIGIITKPAAEPGAASIFLAFTAYSTGPLPEDLLPQLPCPAIILWGTADPWEPFDLARNLANFPQVQKFIPLEGVGHCPQDEVPELVNPIIQDWIREISERDSEMIK